ncbi:hypothetical protein COU19_01995 [Candidatus Kaiserbacteria bacterium CG10_big_fil_rev_8_21_14_0_10_56_12]|uniref:Cell shape-determining protein MreC n=1 Tax=Candidatus Kaiserbacteria bacterium CG10_big_fil_rev_8_21_14_0_10_56_12 TaxID=1974611 RepID=A0A2H0U9Q9_9BACT|nr:MAG: hypothetical protein COU19_01995 [Candidatus Kaiserbacteria bacterium CG10_big_fil_rev_8_21_14_0_10_56_12]
MKKTYLPRRNALLTVRELSWGARAVLLVCAVALVRFALPNVFMQIAAPFLGVSASVARASHAVINSFSSTAEQAAENERLREENVALVAENARLTKQSSQSVVETNVSTTGASRGVVAQVVARPPVGPYDTLVLDQGQSAGVSDGMEVFSSGGVPLGVVTGTTSDFSRAVLFSSPDVQTAGWAGERSVPVTITGRGGGVLVAVLPRSANIMVGDFIYVPGPGMLPIGVVARVDGDATSPAVTLRIRPLSNLFSLGSVELRTTGVGQSVEFASSTAP